MDKTYVVCHFKLPPSMDKEELIHRIKNAIILLSEKHSVKVGELSFYCQDETHFSVAGSTHNKLLETITKQSAIAELADIKSLFLKMVYTSQELTQFIQRKEVDYSLYYDYGMGSGLICSERSGQINWETELNQ